MKRDIGREKQDGDTSPGAGHGTEEAKFSQVLKILSAKMLLHASAESYSTPLQYQLLGKYSASCCDKTKPLKIHNYEDSIKNKKKLALPIYTP